MYAQLKKYHLFLCGFYKKKQEEYSMYKKLLVPLDGSKRVEAILPHVEELAHRYDAKIVYLKIIELFSVMTAQEGFGPDTESVRQSYKEITRRSERSLKGIKGEFCEKGIASKNVVEREDADLIAMASHGRTVLSQVFYGSVAAGVLHRIDRPLLLIRANGK
jgi:nucleotide-binding universal stress UspA family protein